MGKEYIPTPLRNRLAAAEYRAKEAEYLAGPQGPVRLTPMQIKVLESLAQGNRPNEVAAALQVTESCISTHLSRLVKELDERHWFSVFVRWFHQRTAQAIWPQPLPRIAPPVPRNAPSNAEPVSRNSPVDNSAPPWDHTDTGKSTDETQEV